MRLCTLIAFSLSLVASLGCSGSDTQNFERYQERLSGPTDGVSAATRRAQLTRQSEQRGDSSEVGPSPTRLPQERKAQPGDAKTALLGTASQVIRITTPTREVIEVAPGYETALRLEGSNLRSIDSLQVTDSSRIEVPGVHASIEEIVSDKVARVSIRADRDAQFDEPLYIQVLAKDNNILAPISIREDRLESQGRQPGQN